MAEGGVWREAPLCPPWKRKKISLEANGPQSARKMLLLLNEFTAARPKHSVDGLSELIQVPRSTAYRFVALLRDFELLEQTGDGRYQLGPKAITLGYVARSMVDLADLWRPVIEHCLAVTGETTLILRRIGTAAVCVDRVESQDPVRLSFDVGRTMPLHTGAGAKVLLANGPESFQEEYIRSSVPASAQETLRDELKQIKEQGWAESDGEVDPGIWAVAGAILVGPHDSCLSLSIAAPEYRLDEKRKDRIRRVTLEVTEKLRTQLSFR
jgi:DNA-binding IclR family transcriptional regulator